MVHCYKVTVLKVALDVAITNSINLDHTFYLFHTPWAIGSNHIILKMLWAINLIFFEGVQIPSQKLNGWDFAKY